MATVKKSAPRKAPVKKAAVKKEEVAPAVAAPVAASSLTPADLAMIAEIAAKAAAEAVNAANTDKQPHTEAVIPAYAGPMETVRAEHTPGGKRMEAEVFETQILSPEQIAGMSPEQIEEYNKREHAKMVARKARQASTLKDMSSMSVSQRMKALNAPRDPNEIRMAVPEDWDGNEDDLVRVICKRRIGLSNGVMSDLDEPIDMYRPVAKSMQRTGAVEVDL